MDVDFFVDGSCRWITAIGNTGVPRRAKTLNDFSFEAPLDPAFDERALLKRWSWGAG
jgi:hypothetical protein